MADSVVIDITEIFNERVLAPEAHAVPLYDQKVPPPWKNALLCYVNSFNNVVAVHIGAVDVEDFRVKDQWVPDTSLAPGDEPAHVIDWDSVRWVLQCSLWVGGWSSSEQRTIPTTGPVLLWSIAVRGDGEPLDIRWTNFAGKIANPTEWDNTLIAMMAAYNFLACRNVTVAEPVRERAHRRRVERAGNGVVVHEIVVSPTGKSRPHASDLVPLFGSAVAAHSVRGHFSEYGTNGKGLLFGKFAGRFWVPQHIRGTSERGEVEQHFKLTTASGSKA